MQIFNANLYECRENYSLWYENNYELTRFVNEVYKTDFDIFEYKMTDDGIFGM